MSIAVVFALRDVFLGGRVRECSTRGDADRGDVRAGGAEQAVERGKPWEASTDVPYEHGVSFKFSDEVRQRRGTHGISN